MPDRGARSSETAAAPVAEGARLDALDVLRGFALLGILLMNVVGYAHPLAVVADPHAGLPQDAWNRGVLTATDLLVSGKFAFLFAMLFGAGLVFYARKTDQHGRPAGTRLWFRRMASLLVIGLAHGILIWPGDVLTSYALTGLLVLWWCRSWSARTTLVVAAVLLAFGTALIAVLAAGASNGPAVEPVTPDEAAAWLGPYADGVRLRAQRMLDDVLRFPFVVCLGTSYMLLGAGLLRCGVLSGARSPRVGLWMAGLGLGIGLPSAWLGLDSGALAAVLPVPIGLGYVGALLWLLQTGRLGVVRRALAAVGRMALTNYLLQSILCALVFYTPGLGQFGQLAYPELLGVVAVVWATNVFVSLLWLRRCQYGPAEWVWRTVTYGRRPALLRR